MGAATFGCVSGGGVVSPVFGAPRSFDHAQRNPTSASAVGGTAVRKWIEACQPALGATVNDAPRTTLSLVPSAVHSITPPSMSHRPSPEQSSCLVGASTGLLPGFISAALAVSFGVVRAAISHSASLGNRFPSALHVATA